MDLIPNNDGTENFGFATKAIHVGFQKDPATGAIMPPICLSSTFAQNSPGDPIKYEYARTGNPTRDALQTNLAVLENAKYGIAFASGCAALNTLLQTLPKDSHVLLNDDVYGGTYRLLANVFSEFGFTFTQCDMSDPAAIKAAITKNTQLIWIETPSNPLLKIIDIQLVGEIKQQLAPHAIFAVDNTFATPYLQNPLNLGADLVCHSTTKYIGGHSDVVGGALLLNQSTLADKLLYLQNAIGAVPSPMDCFLLLRSTKTLALRMQKHCENARVLAEFLQAQPKVSHVYYPGFPTHPNHQVAKRQMRDFGGMISFVLDCPIDQVKRFFSGLEVITLAESLGGVESLIEHPALMTHAAVPQTVRQQIGVADGLVRFSVGIEDPQDLINDLKRGLNFLR